jgi:hypothetical protein
MYIFLEVCRDSELMYLLHTSKVDLIVITDNILHLTDSAAFILKKSLNSHTSNSPDSFKQKQEFHFS